MELCCCSHPSTARSPRALRAQRALHIVPLRCRRVKCPFSRSSSVRAGCESLSNISCGSSLYDSTSTLDCIKIIGPVHLKLRDSGRWVCVTGLPNHPNHPPTLRQKITLLCIPISKLPINKVLGQSYNSNRILERRPSRGRRTGFRSLERGPPCAPAAHEAVARTPPGGSFELLTWRSLVNNSSPVRPNSAPRN